MCSERLNNNTYNMARIYHKELKEKWFVSSANTRRTSGEKCMFSYHENKQPNIGSTCSLQRTKLLLLRKTVFCEAAV